MNLRRLVVFFAALLTACSSTDAGSPPISEVRAELLGYVGDVIGADGYRYQVTDDLGHTMDTAKIIEVEETGEFAAVYHWWSDDTGQFTSSVATSSNLLDWTWRADLAEGFSMPYLKAASDGGYVASWESDADNTITLVYFPTWSEVLSVSPSKSLHLDRQTPGCAEGTVNIYEASSTHVDFGFHYFANCESDRQARGTTDWTTWTAELQPLLDRAAIFQGYRGSIGDRDYIEYEGYGFTFLEAQLTQGDWNTFRVLLYDDDLGAADRESWLEFPGSPWPPPSMHVFIATHAGSASFTNLSITQVEFQGRPTLVMGVGIPNEGSGGDEAGELIYYQFIDEPAR